MSDKGDLQYVAAIDTSAYDGALDHMVASATEASSQITSESAKIQELLNNIPEVNIDFLQSINNVEEMKNGIGEAFANIHRVIRENEEALVELAQAYNETTSEANKFANVPSMREHYEELRQQKTAIKEVISARKQAIASAKEAEKTLTKETKSLLESAKAKQQNNTQAQSLRQRIRELEMEAAALVDTAHQEGVELDQTKGRYREIIEELGRLRNIRGDIQQAGSAFANDENQIAGIIQGLSGLSGAFSVAQGAVGLFGAENERLNEIMMKVQSLMAITMGLQQVQQVLNKDSTFSLITLNAIKRLFNKNSEETAAVLSDENAELADNIKQTQEDIVQKETAEIAEVADTEATIKNTSATKGNAAAQTQNATAEKSATASTNAHTASMVAATVATKAGTVALKLFKLALISTGIGVLIWGVGELVSWIVKLCSAEEEESEAAKAAKEANEEGAKAYAKARAEISSYINRIENFNGTQAEEKRLLKEVNDKFGEQLGYANDLNTAKDILAQKGNDYCRALEAEAVAQAYLNKYVEAYINLLQVQENVKSGEYHHWYNTKSGDAAADREAEAAAQADVDRYMQAYEEKMLEAQQTRQNAQIGGHVDPVAGTGTPTNKWDGKKAAAEQRKILEDYTKKVREYVQQMNDSIAQANIDSMESAYYRERNAVHNQYRLRTRDIQKEIEQMAIALRDATKAYNMQRKGFSEDDWNASEQGKRTVADWVALLKEQNPEIASGFTEQIEQADNELQRQLSEIYQKYFKQLVDEFGTYDQKFEQLSQEWQERIGLISTTFPEFLPEAIKQMEEAFSKLKTEDFQKTINWDVVFGNLDDQSLQSLQVSLDKVKTYFAQEGTNMSVEQIKIFQEAIDKMETEIASRNPFTAMHKSFSDISTAKTEFVNALAEMRASQEALTAAQNEHNEAFRAENDLRATVKDANRDEETDALMAAQRNAIKTEQDYQNCLAKRDEVMQRINNGELAADCQELTDATTALTNTETARNAAIAERDTLMQNMNDDELAQQCITLVNAQDRLAKSETNLTAAHTRNNKAEQRTLTARNNITKSYKTFAANLNAAGKVTTEVGKKASNLARVFSKDIADGMDKALDCIDEVLDATTDVISAVGDVGKSVAKGVEATVDGVAQGTQATATAAATSISTVEKASVILTVISAALQVATAIANLFNDDESKQKEIERLQERVDQLRWELDNQDAVRLQKNVGNALEQLKRISAEARAEVLRLHGVMQNASLWSQWIAQARYQNEIYAKTVEKLADYWAKAGYTADKALGSQRYESSRKQLENLAEQQLLIQKQINEESSKKDSDSGKIQDYKNKIAELAEEMATLINEMLEDIIGASAEDIAKQLGDAFFDAVKSGEDAMEAWRDKVNEIVSDILRRMMIQKFLEEPLGQIFDKYKKKWFGEDGRFKGIDNIIGSMDEFSEDLNAVGSTFQSIMNELPDEVRQWFAGDEEREASQRGIATASQDSVDENNARLATIQSHTYTLVQGVAELNATGSQVLERLANIDDNTKETAEKLDTVQTDVKRLKDAVEDITTQGLKLKS